MPDHSSPEFTDHILLAVNICHYVAYTFKIKTGCKCSLLPAFAHLHRNSFLINGIAYLFTNEFSKICDIITNTGLF